MVLRQEVFVVEQDCPYLDADGKDQQSLHVLGHKKDDLVAYARIVDPGISYEERSVGRVICKESHRKERLGSQLMEVCHRHILANYSDRILRISAQSHLEVFYQRLGYQPTGKAYLEDGIPHIEMLAELKN